MPEKTLEAVIPVYKPGNEFYKLLKRLDKQIFPVRMIHLMYTTEEESLPELPHLNTPVEVYTLKPEEFDHAGTRNAGFSLCKSDYILCMTQDALPVDDRLTLELVSAFSDDRCAVAYARQMARKEHGAVECYTRSFNYPAQNRVQDLEHLDDLGIKTYFCSDACALYRRDLCHDRGTDRTARK